MCSRCSSLSKFDPFSSKDHKCKNANVPDRMRGQPACGSLGNRAGKIEPVRFVAFCPKGHIQDLPYIKLCLKNVLGDVILNQADTLLLKAFSISLMMVEGMDSIAWDVLNI